MIDRLLTLIHGHERFVITTHVRPDGDAIGSQLALGGYLRRLGKTVHLLNSDPPAYNLGWLPGVDDVATYDGSLAQREWLDQADVVFIVDTNARARIGQLADPVAFSRAKVAVIDHHTDPEDGFDLLFVRDSASSAGELVYELIAADRPDLIDDDIATALYAAIMTDTGSFRYSSVTAAVHRIVADLMERADLEPDVIHAALYDTRSLAGLRLLGHALSGVTLRYDGQVGYMVIPQRLLREMGADSHDTEGFVNYVLSVEGVRAALIFIETDSGAKISFRSKGDAHVNGWAQAFGGGGHRNASGAYVRRPLEDVVQDVVDAAPRFLDLGDAHREDDLSEEDASYLASLMDLKSQNASS